MSEIIVWLNGRLLPASEASTPVCGPGLMLGEGIFETLMWNQGLMALDRHWQRLSHGLTALQLPPVELDLMRQALESVHQANRSTCHRLRFTVTRRADGSTDQFATAGPLRTWPEAEKVALAPWRRNEHCPLAGVKSTSYAANSLIHRWAATLGCGEALMLNTQGHLAEGTGSNVFLSRADGTLVTPPLSSGCLPGVTREILLENLPQVQQASISLDDLLQASEVFLTSSTRMVQAVVSCDGRVFPFVDGQVTQSARQLLMNAMQRETS